MHAHVHALLGHLACDCPCLQTCTCSNLAIKIYCLLATVAVILVKSLVSGQVNLENCMRHWDYYYY